MSEKPPEPVAESAEPEALPTPSVSPPSPAAPSAAPDLGAELARLKNDLLSELKVYVDRSSQSVKDRRIAGLEKRFEELTAAKTALDAHGGDAMKAARDLVIDEILSRQEQPANPGTVGEDWTSGVEKILGEAEKLGVKVDSRDPEIQAVAKGTYASWADAYAAVNRVVLRRAKGVPAGTVPGEVSGIPASSPNVDELTNQLTTLMRTGAPMEAILAAKKRLLEVQ